ncbi:FAD-dependent protein [Variovorax sp. PCZ-1]|uniref:NAD(P)/FAD-dependent oxidoreductase n=1 Tax=Variovorax sp. PCZ-1 TaxID=2835533 RepID=UPI001BCF117B|nr:hypothetical protein [Variovorax sp. PCZ-1]MBS7807685.1 hypothetical protein [Variovorax sp. PCZ-1]
MNTAIASIRVTEIKLPLDHQPEALRKAVCHKLNIKDEELLDLHIFRRGYDARKKSDIHFIYTLDVRTSDNAAVLARAKKNAKTATHVNTTPDTEYKQVAHAPQRDFLRPIVVGTGPCGLFAALNLAQMGFKPLILERGRIVRERTKDTWGFWRKRDLKVESNVQFGEGGAGTFSDGKLWSQVKDPLFHGRKVMQEMVRGGAPDEIMYVSKPHVGTFRLVKVVEFLREEIERLGGEFRFSTKLVDLKIEGGSIRGITTEHPERGIEQIDAEHVILALGHSARDTFEMLLERGVYAEAKPFSVGFRIEHPQSLIDRARLGPNAGNELLGAADYKLVHHASNGRSVYSFCMCPGGTVVAATSEEKRVVTNGMSQYSRNERNANAGIVVGIEPKDYDFDAQGKPLVAEAQRGQILAGMRFQRALESGAYLLGGENYNAPSQRVGDFLRNIASKELGDVIPSYKPGVHLMNLGDTKAPALPMYAIEAIREAIPAFAQQIADFDLHDAMLTGVETRTSSPIRIKRHEPRLEGGRRPDGQRHDEHPLRYQSINTRGLYPAGEGAGYAGGIMSAAIDGLKVAEAVALNICKPS